MGQPWQSRRGSSVIWGVWHDAGHIAEQIEIQSKYRSYKSQTQTQPQTQDA